MKPTYTFSLTLLAGVAGSELAKAVIVPMFVWSSTIAGSALYVHWVIKSHEANVVRLHSNFTDSSTESEIPADQFLADLNALVEKRQIYVSTYRSDTLNGYYVTSKIQSLRGEDAKVLTNADQLRLQSPGAYSSEIATKVDELKRLDDQLKAFGDQAASRSSNGL